MAVAIVSTNRDKYSETFIQHSIKWLPGNVHLLFDGHLPQQYSLDRGATANYFLSVSPERATRQQLINAIETYLERNNIQVILCQYGPAGAEMMPLAQKKNIALIVHFYGFDAYRKDVLNYYGGLYADMFSGARAVIAVSQHMQRQLIRLGCSHDKLKIFRLGVNTDIFKPQNRTTLSPVFVACGRFTEKKAPHLTIQAFEKVLQEMPAAMLIMIGDGELLDQCKALAARLNIADSVIFKGVLSQMQIASEFSRGSVFVQHSVTAFSGDSEGTPVAILEAMASGLAVVSTRHGGIPEVVTEGQTGLLVNENDVAGMAQNMLWLLRNKQQALSMAMAATAEVHKNCTVRQYLRQLTSIIDQAVTIHPHEN